MVKKIAVISDISLGYGTPQIIDAARSLLRHYQTTENLIIETDQPERPPVHYLYQDLNIQRVKTAFSRHGAVGKIEYLTKTAKLLDDFKPDVVLVPNGSCLSALWLAKHKPQKTIYYVLEVPNTFSHDPLEERLNHEVAKVADLVIFPEENRAFRHIRHYGYEKIPMGVAYNVPPLRQHAPLPTSQRKARLFYQGTVDNPLTCAEHFIDPSILSLPMDIYGLVTGEDHQKIRKLLSSPKNQTRYRGYCTNTEVAEYRRQAAFSVVIWNPINEIFRDACPNKFFESIADGVPPICAPHPQLVHLIKKYDCGILMDDWSLASFRQALKRALDLFGSPRYEELVQRCYAAHRSELNWEEQFDPLLKFLDA